MDKSTVLDTSKLPWRSNETTVDWSDMGGAGLQQNQIIKYLLSEKRSSEIFENEDIEASDAERAKVLAAFRANKVTAAMETALLLDIRDPLNNPNIGLTKIYWAIMADPRARQIISVIAGYNERNWQEFDESDLEKFLTEKRDNGADFRTPVGFMLAKQQFLDGIRPHASAEIYTAYERSMKSLEVLLYGKRLEYYQQFENLRQEALGERMAKVAEPKTDSTSSAAKAATLKTTQSTPKSTATNQEKQVSAPKQINSAAVHTKLTSHPKAKSTDGASTASTPNPTAASTTIEKASALRDDDPFNNLPSAESTVDETPTIETLSYQILSSDRADAMLARTLIEGDGWRQNNREYRLNVHHLMRAGLRPTYEVKFEGRDWYFSEPFYITSGRIAILGYTNMRGGIKIRSFYRAQPQGLWRYIPDYVRDANKSSGIGALGQGFNEDSLFLPVELQQVLAKIEKEAEIRKITLTNPNFFLAGPMKAYDSLMEYREAMRSGRMVGDYYNEVSSEAMSYEFRMGIGGHRDAPQTLSIAKAKSPDFSRKVAEFETYSNFVGRTQVEAFLSHDEQLKWVFCRDAKKRVWIARVEAAGPMTSVGLRKNWVLMGELTTPLYEYSRKTGGYGDPYDVKGPCQCMWKNYLSKISVIRSYMQYKADY